MRLIESGLTEESRHCPPALQLWETVASLALAHHGGLHSSTASYLDKRGTNLLIERLAFFPGMEL